MNVALCGKNLIPNFVNTKMGLFQSKVNYVNVIRLEGEIGINSDINYRNLEKNLTKAFNGNPLAVCLLINSPGGSPVQSDMIANRIVSLSKAKEITVYSFIEDMAASGGYYLACAGKEIYANPSSTIGSIGVVSSGFGFVELLKRFGIERRVVTQGKNKALMDPFLPQSREEVEILNDVQGDLYDTFVEFIKLNRGDRLKQPDNFLFNGRIWSGKKALEYGLIDGTDHLHDFVENSFNKAKIQYINEPKSNLEKWLFSSHLVLPLPQTQIFNHLLHMAC